MAIDLQNSQNIATGWGRPPDFSAPNISGVLGDILQQRRYQEALQQKQIADAVKAIQEQRQQDAYASALRDTGLSEGQDLSGVSSADQTRIAQMLMQRTPDTQRDALIQAQIAHLNRSGGGGRGGGGSGQPGDAAGPEFVYDADGTKYLVVRTSKSTTYHRVPNQPGGGAATKLSPTERGWAAPEIPGVSVDVNAPDDPGKFLPPDTSPMPGAPSVPPLLKRPPSGVPQAAPAETGDTIQTSKVQPTTGGAGNVIINNTTGLPLHPPGGGADKNLAPNYGVQGVKMQAPDGTVKTVDPDRVDYYKSKGAVIVQ